MSKTFKTKEKIGIYTVYEINDLKARGVKMSKAFSFLVKNNNGENILSFYSEDVSDFQLKVRGIKTFLEKNKLLELNQWMVENFDTDSYINGEKYNSLLKDLKTENNKKQLQQQENNNQSPVNNKVGYSSGNTDNQKRYSQEYKQLPIFALIEALEANDYISMVGNLENNGSETKYRFEIKKDTRKITDNLIVSTVSREQYSSYPEKAHFYVEFKGYFKNIKGSAGEYNFMLDMERLGAFGEPLSKNSFNNEDDYKKSLKEKVRPILNSLRRYSFENHGRDFIINEKTGGFHSRRMKTPQTLYKAVSFNDKLKPLRELNETLMLRGFSKEIINDSISKGVIRFSTYINPKFGFRNYAISANMHNIFNPKFPQGFETFFIKEKGKFQKMFASIKRTQRNAANQYTGENYILNVDLSNDKVNGTIFSEAVLDSIALKDIMLYCGFKYSNYNHIAAQGVGNMVNFFRDNFGFYYMQDDDEVDGKYKKGDIRIVEKKYERKIIPKDDYEKISQSLKDIKIKFIFDESKKGSSAQLFKLKSFFKEFGISDNIEVINIPYPNAKVDLNKSKDDGVYIMDNTNVNKFFDENNFFVEYSKDKKGYIYYRDECQELERDFDHNRDSLKELGLRVKKVLGSKNIYLAFDNDTAGLKHYEPLSIMCRNIGLRCRATIPPFHIYGEENKRVINDNNDVLMFVRYLESLNKIDKKEIVSWVKSNFLDGFKNDMSVDLINESLKKARKIKEIESNKKLSNSQKEDMLMALLKKNPPARNRISNLNYN